jgi:spermidine dehydrogenase
VRGDAHLIRDGLAPELAAKAIDTGEVFDMIVVGGGFSGAGAAYQFKEKFGDSRNCLILDNHPIFGGEAKQNEFDVDGYRLYGPQGSNGFLPPVGNTTLSDEIFRKVGMPMDYSFAGPAPGRSSVKAPFDSFDTMYWGERNFDVGYFFGKDGWVRNIWSDDLARTHWNSTFRNDLSRVYSDKSTYYDGSDYARWLDGMSYKTYLEKEVGVGAGIAEFLGPIMGLGGFALGADVISAYAAHLLFMPATTGYGAADTYDLSNLPAIYSFPGGNTGYFRHIAKYLNPAVIKGGNSFEEILNNPIDFAALDRSGDAFRFRQGATVIDVRHRGPAEMADLVDVTYRRGGKTYRAQAKTVVMAIGGWVVRRIVSDMPDELLNAYNQFNHGPVLVVNVALTNWRFLNRLGISSARWFEGFGGFCSIRRPMEVGGSVQPFDPDKPTVLTFYVPFNYPGEDIRTQTAMGRTELLSKSYAHYEGEILAQMHALFGDAGFDASRDIAGIVLNRWGHAYVAPQPGFYFPHDGSTAPKDIVKRGYGRIRFGHSELGSRMNYRNAIAEGGSAADAVMELI